MKVAVSACLLGRNCKYDGGNNLDKRLVAWLEEHEVVEVCPEMAGGLSTPRVPAELREGRVIDAQGTDVTAAFKRGALRCFEESRDCDAAVLKAKSPSCGVHFVYDGTFSGRLVAGKGVFAGLLEERGVPAFEPDDAQLAGFLGAVR